MLTRLAWLHGEGAGRFTPEITSLGCWPASRTSHTLSWARSSWRTLSIPPCTGSIDASLAVLAVFVVIPFVTAYLLLDLDGMKQSLATVVPEDRWRATLSFLSDVDRVIGGFIRGQHLVAGMIAILITVALILIHVPYRYLFGLMAGLGDLIAYVPSPPSFPHFLRRF